MTDEAERARQRDLVRRGYDEISRSYRSDDGSSSVDSSETTETYAAWIDELTALLPPGASVLDLGCGAGVPASRLLAEAGCSVTGIDISAVQVARARDLVPRADFVCADLAEWDAEAGSFDAVLSLYALIHVPLEDQRDVLPRMRRWLKDGGYVLAIVGAGRWTGTEDYFGTKMFWDHADGPTYLAWFADAGLQPVWDRYVPEGDAGHTLILARAT